jgi:phosphoesterase RecJ-like protein
VSRAEAIAIAERGERFLVTCHIRPDADALGSAIGFGVMLRALGREAVVYSQDGVPPNLTFLEGSESVVNSVPEGTFDATFVMDAAAKSLVPNLPERVRTGPVIIVDHHAAHDGFGDIVVREIDACSTGEVVLRLWHDLARAEAIPRPAAQPIYAAVVADTGGFRYPGTTGDTLRIGAQLLDHGVSPWAVASNLFERWSRERMVLLGEVLRGLEVELDGAFAIVCVDRAMMDRSGATDEMLEGMVNYGRMLAGVRVAALLWIPRGTVGEVKLSFRSDGDVDVAAIAVSLGGGGHRTAAGVSMSASSLDVARARVLGEVKGALATP